LSSQRFASESGSNIGSKFAAQPKLATVKSGAAKEGLMKRKILSLLVVMVCTGGASAVYGQFGFGIKRPNIANIFHPVVGAGASYERTDKEGKKSAMEMSVVGSEMVGTQQGYWMEVGHSARNSEDMRYGKMLVTPADFVFHKMIMVMPGSTQPMEMDMEAAKSHRDTMDKDLEKWHSVGTETISVPAGTFSCEHWTKDEGQGDVWVSSKVSPMGMVKSVENGDTLVLTKLITGAKTHITGTPVKFDPQMMRQQMQNQMNKPKP
jgi:hypothetical protein